MAEWKKIIRKLNTHHWTPRIRNTSILIIDMQEYFRTILRPILDNILPLLQAAKEREISVFFTRHQHRLPEEPGMLGKWWADLILKDTPEANLLPELGPISEEKVIIKNTYSAFYKTVLDKKLKQGGIKDLVIGGVMTNLCCETTAREAFVRGYRVFFLADGTSTVNEDFHLATLKNLSYGFATLLTCQQLRRFIQR